MKTYEQAAVERDAGMAKVSIGSRGWQSLAYAHLYMYARSHEQFLIEEVREFAYANGLPKPHDGRAWGPVARTAAKRGIIKSIGFGHAKTGHLRPMPLWKSLVFKQEEATASRQELAN